MDDTSWTHWINAWPEAIFELIESATRNRRRAINNRVAQDVIDNLTPEDLRDLDELCSSAKDHARSVSFMRRILEEDYRLYSSLKPENTRILNTKTLSIASTVSRLRREQLRSLYLTNA